MKHEIDQPPLDDRLSLEEAATYLKCSKQTLYTDGCKSGAHRFPFYRVGGRRQYSKRELDSVIRRTRVASREELQQEAMGAR